MANQKRRRHQRQQFINWVKERVTVYGSSVRGHTHPTPEPPVPRHNRHWQIFICVSLAVSLVFLRVDFSWLCLRSWAKIASLFHIRFIVSNHFPLFHCVPSAHQWRLCCSKITEFDFFLPCSSSACLSTAICSMCLIRCIHCSGGASGLRHENRNSANSLFFAQIPSVAVYLIKCRQEWSIILWIENTWSSNESYEGWIGYLWIFWFCCGIHQTWAFMIFIFFFSTRWSR